MNIYKIERNGCDYDEYDAFVLRAEDRKKALELAIKEESAFNTSTSIKITLCAKDVKGQRGIILGSFNAG